MIREFLQPYTGMIRMAALGLVGVAALGLAGSWYMRGQKIDRLTEWQDRVLTATAVAGGFKDLAPEDVPTVIEVVGANAREYERRLVAIDADTATAKQESDARDEALRRSLATEQQRYKAATRRIDTLEGRLAASTPEAAAAQIDADSKAAWEGWKQ